MDRDLLTKLNDIVFLLNKLNGSTNVVKENSATSDNNEQSIIDQLDDAIESLQTIATNSGTADPNIANIKADTTNIYNILNDRLIKKVILTRAEYDALVSGGTVDDNTLYYVIESQNN